MKIEQVCERVVRATCRTLERKYHIRVLPEHRADIAALVCAPKSLNAMLKGESADGRK